MHKIWNGVSVLAQPELFEIKYADIAIITSIAKCDDVLNILISHRVVKVVGEDSLKVWRFKAGATFSSFHCVENSICFDTLSFFTFLLVPAMADDFFEKFKIEATAICVLRVELFDICFFLTIILRFEAEVIDNRL